MQEFRGGDPLMLRLSKLGEGFFRSLLGRESVEPMNRTGWKPVPPVAPASSRWWFQSFIINLC